MINCSIKDKVKAPDERQATLFSRYETTGPLFSFQAWKLILQDPPTTTTLYASPKNTEVGTDVLSYLSSGSCLGHRRT